MDEFTMPDTATIEQLDAMATEKLSEIVRRYTAKEYRWRGYEASEVEAARELLAKSSTEIAR